MHQSIVEVGTKICEIDRRARRGDRAHAPRPRRRRRARRPAHRRRRHAPVLELEGPGHLARRALPGHRRGSAGRGARYLIFGLHVHVGRARSHVDDRSDERGALLPAAPAGALDELAVLAGTRHRAEIVPHDGVQALPAHRHPRSLRVVDRVRAVRRSRWSRRTASTTARRSGGTCGRTRSSTRSSSASATCRRASTTPIAIAALIQAMMVKLYLLRKRNLGFRHYHARAHRGEQVARRALRASTAS